MYSGGTLRPMENIEDNRRGKVRVQLCGGWWGDESQSEANMYCGGWGEEPYGQWRISKIIQCRR